MRMEQVSNLRGTPRRSTMTSQSFQAPTATHRIGGAALVATHRVGSIAPVIVIVIVYVAVIWPCSKRRIKALKRRRKTHRLHNELVMPTFQFVVQVIHSNIAIRYWLLLLSLPHKCERLRQHSLSNRVCLCGLLFLVSQSVRQSVSQPVLKTVR